jgi:hypothetical protein
MKASDLIAAMEEGKTVQKVLNPKDKNPQIVWLNFMFWDAGKQRTVRVNSNQVLRPSSRSNWRDWLGEMIECPEEWSVA